MRLRLADGSQVFGRGCYLGPPAGPPRASIRPLLITPYIPLVEAWLRSDLTIKATVVHERLWSPSTASAAIVSESRFFPE